MKVLVVLALVIICTQCEENVAASCNKPPDSVVCIVGTIKVKPGVKPEKCKPGVKEEVGVKPETCKQSVKEEKGVKTKKCEPGVEICYTAVNHTEYGCGKCPHASLKHCRHCSGNPDTPCNSPGPPGYMMLISTLLLPFLLALCIMGQLFMGQTMGKMRNKKRTLRTQKHFWMKQKINLDILQKPAFSYIKSK